MEKDKYHTIQGISEGLFKDRGSKFIAYAFPVENTDEVKLRLEEVKSEHHNARHYCYAYKLGPAGKEYRANDDGEPSGSAGKPILGQLTKYALSDTLIVVVRYFGGTKLGVGGLINAYKNAAAESILSAEIIEKIVTDKFELLFSYALIKDVEHLCKNLGVIILKREFTEDCRIICKVRKGAFEEVLSTFQNIHGIQVKA